MVAVEVKAKLDPVYSPNAPHAIKALQVFINDCKTTNNQQIVGNLMMMAEVLLSTCEAITQAESPKQANLH